jgi:hypothetical protein
MPVFHIPLLAKIIGVKPYGITLGPFIFIWGPLTNKAVAHEQEHYRQFIRDPFGFYPKYLYELLRNVWNGKGWYDAYLAISYEKQAREAAKNVK